MMNKYYLLEALQAKLTGEKAVHEANIRVYLESAAGIGEHAQIVDAVESEVEKLANAQEKWETVTGLLDIL